MSESTTQGFRADWVAQINRHLEADEKCGCDGLSECRKCNARILLVNAGGELTRLREQLEEKTEELRKEKIENKSVKALPAYVDGLVDGQHEIVKDLDALYERWSKMGHIHSVKDALETAINTAGRVFWSSEPDGLSELECALADAEAKVERVRRLHRERTLWNPVSEKAFNVCVACECDAPCLTIRALDGAASDSGNTIPWIDIIHEWATEQRIIKRLSLAHYHALARKIRTALGVPEPSLEEKKRAIDEALSKYASDGGGEGAK